MHPAAPPPYCAPPLRQPAPLRRVGRRKPVMTGAEIAALVGVASDIAVVRRDTGPDQREIPVTETIEIHQADHFLVTRRVVEGGHDADRAHAAGQHPDSSLAEACAHPA